MVLDSLLKVFRKKKRLVEIGLDMVVHPIQGKPGRVYVEMSKRDLEILIQLISTREDVKVVDNGGVK